jgi:hypothetical protein
MHEQAESRRWTLHLHLAAGFTPQKHTQQRQHLFAQFSPSMTHATHTLL